MSLCAVVHWQCTPRAHQYIESGVDYERNNVRLTYMITSLSSPKIFTIYDHLHLRPYVMPQNERHPRVRKKRASTTPSELIDANSETTLPTFLTMHLHPRLTKTGPAVFFGSLAETLGLR